MSQTNPEFARQFAAAWAEAWNAHDLERILSHYEDDFEMRSPVIVELAHEPSGCLRGKAAMRAYWGKALAVFPSLRFELLDALGGMGSVVIYYRGHRGCVAEVFEFGVSGKVARAHAHYA
jgi:ketosteroid isomerase-like protein